MQDRHQAVGIEVGQFGFGRQAEFRDQFFGRDRAFEGDKSEGLVDHRVTGASAEDSTAITSDPRNKQAEEDSPPASLAIELDRGLPLGELLCHDPGSGSGLGLSDRAHSYTSRNRRTILWLKRFRRKVMTNSVSPIAKRLL